MFTLQRCGVTRRANINRAVVELLASNKIMARYSGWIEFGGRALGNRSILASGSDFTHLTTGNGAIKIRCFWMPSTGSTLEEDMLCYMRKSRPHLGPLPGHHVRQLAGSMTGADRV